MSSQLHHRRPFDAVVSFVAHAHAQGLLEVLRRVAGQHLELHPATAACFSEGANTTHQTPAEPRPACPVVDEEIVDIERRPSLVGGVDRKEGGQLGRLRCLA